MKNYSRNKGFIPESFIEKTENGNQNIEKKILMVFLCINLMYIPFNINLINKKDNKKVEKINEQSYSEKEGLDYENIYSMMQVLLSDDVKECNVSSEGGSLIVDSIDKAESISNKNIINADDMYLKDDGTFEVRVSAYEKNMD
ncbi:MAG: hypothetical protein Q4F66_05045 [Clostridium sp.]|nr:hypothetical protein [Clostridium sp.]